MFKFLFVVFFLFLLLVFLMGFSILRTFKNIFFGSSTDRKKEEYRSANNRSQASSSQHTSATGEDARPSHRRKKIFGKDEGEYVDYEEVK